MWTLLLTHVNLIEALKYITCPLNYTTNCKKKKKNSLDQWTKELRHWSLLTTNLHQMHCSVSQLAIVINEGTNQGIKWESRGLIRGKPKALAILRTKMTSLHPPIEKWSIPKFPNLFSSVVNNLETLVLYILNGGNISIVKWYLFRSFTNPKVSSKKWKILISYVNSWLNPCHT